ncbi:hypothetical protein HMPREF0880_04176 [Yokenella regensburgei ATCC 43003]|jgi:hypothetical protein|nr:hypothetical protein HMPREF0880_04176 [Yokenella regensburgei ATCC 43003]
MSLLNFWRNYFSREKLAGVTLDDMLRRSRKREVNDKVWRL